MLHPKVAMRKCDTCMAGKITYSQWIWSKVGPILAVRSPHKFEDTKSTPYYFGLLLTFSVAHMFTRSKTHGTPLELGMFTHRPV